MKNLNLQRIVMEVFGGCNYTCQMCPQTNPGRGKGFTRKMPLNEFKRILNDLVPKYGNPQINLEGSGEPTMAKDLPEYVKAVKEKGLKCFMYCNGARLNGKFMQDVISPFSTWPFSNGSNGTCPSCTLICGVLLELIVPLNCSRTHDSWGRAGG
jgi:MoaA/NifB/PqqE/SkfB family radical SAM enzyme